MTPIGYDLTYSTGSATSVEASLAAVGRNFAQLEREAVRTASALEAMGPEAQDALDMAREATVRLQRDLERLNSQTVFNEMAAQSEAYIDAQRRAKASTDALREAVTGVGPKADLSWTALVTGANQAAELIDRVVGKLKELWAGLERGAQANDIAKAFERMGGTADSLARLKTAIGGIADDTTIQQTATFARGLGITQKSLEQLLGTYTSFQLAAGKAPTEAISGFRELIAGFASGAVESFAKVGVSSLELQERMGELAGPDGLAGLTEAERIALKQSAALSLMMEADLAPASEYASARLASVRTALANIQSTLEASAAAFIDQIGLMEGLAQHAEGLSERLSTAATETAKVRDAMAELTGETSTTTTTVVTSADAWDAFLTGVLFPVEGAIEALNSGIQLASIAWQAFTPAIDGVSEALSSAWSWLTEENTALVGYAAATADATDRTWEFTEAVYALATAKAAPAQEQVASIDDYLAPVERFSDELARASALAKDLDILPSMLLDASSNADAARAGVQQLFDIASTGREELARRVESGEIAPDMAVAWDKSLRDLEFMLDDVDAQIDAFYAGHEQRIRSGGERTSNAVQESLADTLAARFEGYVTELESGWVVYVEPAIEQWRARQEAAAEQLREDALSIWGSDAPILGETFTSISQMISGTAEDIEFEMEVHAQRLTELGELQQAFSDLGQITDAAFEAFGVGGVDPFAFVTAGAEGAIHAIAVLADGTKTASQAASGVISAIGGALSAGAGRGIKDAQAAAKVQGAIEIGMGLAEGALYAASWFAATPHLVASLGHFAAAAQLFTASGASAPAHASSGGAGASGASASDRRRKDAGLGPADNVAVNAGRGPAPGPTYQFFISTFEPSTSAGDNIMRSVNKYASRDSGATFDVRAWSDRPAFQGY